MVYFVADTHFNHYNILCHCNRPFENLAEMDEALIDNWNSVVGKGETVYHLGDFAFCTAKHASDWYLSKLNGNVHLVIGNHDKKARKCPDFVSTEKIVELTLHGQKITLCHYAMRTWNCKCHGAWHLYGHSHGQLADDPNSCSLDVGVDSWEFTPVSFEQVEAVMTEKQLNYLTADRRTG